MGARYPAVEICHDTADRLGTTCHTLRLRLGHDVFTDEADVLLAPLAAVATVCALDPTAVEERLAGYILLDDEHYL